MYHELPQLKSRAGARRSPKNVEAIPIFVTPRSGGRFDVKILVDLTYVRAFRVERDMRGARGRTFAQVDEKDHRTVRPM